MIVLTIEIHQLATHCMLETHPNRSQRLAVARICVCVFYFQSRLNDSNSSHSLRFVFLFWLFHLFIYFLFVFRWFFFSLIIGFALLRWLSFSRPFFIYINLFFKEIYIFSPTKCKKIDNKFIVNEMFAVERVIGWTLCY